MTSSPPPATPSASEKALSLVQLAAQRCEWVAGACSDDTSPVLGVSHLYTTEQSATILCVSTNGTHPNVDVDVEVDTETGTRVGASPGLSGLGPRDIRGPVDAALRGWLSRRERSLDRVIELVVSENPARTQDSNSVDPPGQHWDPVYSWATPDKTVRINLMSTDSTDESGAVHLVVNLKLPKEEEGLKSKPKPEPEPEPESQSGSMRQGGEWGLSSLFMRLASSLTSSPHPSEPDL